jgi:predicted  nucleic acid-binding Zn-ribbon protein
MDALKCLPDSFKEELLAFLEDEEQVNVLKDQLLKTSIVIEDGEYQITIDSVDKLDELIIALRKLFVVV